MNANKGLDINTLQIYKIIYYDYLTVIILSSIISSIFAVRYS